MMKFPFASLRPQAVGGKPAFYSSKIIALKKIQAAGQEPPAQGSSFHPPPPPPPQSPGPGSGPGFQRLSGFSGQIPLLQAKLNEGKAAASRKGQTAIFLLLIFQILFVLFAVSLNVALFVHDKINLQNAVDLGAYYGAKKQAEVLNAIAHINFQMRQNYKLLAWRYRILGTATVTQGLGPGANKWCIWRKKNNGCANPRDGLCPPAYCDDSYVFCASANLWQRNIAASSDGRQNLCENINFQIQRITRLPPPVAPFVPTNSIAFLRQIELQNTAGRSCKAESGLNWLMVQALLTHFRLDQKDRKMMIHAIHNASLKEGKDLDGQSIEEKVKQTVESNLTEINRNNFAAADFKVHNSIEGEDIDDFLEAYEIYHKLQYAFFSGDSGEACQERGRRFSDDDGNRFDWTDEVLSAYRSAFQQLKSVFNKNTRIQPPNEKFINPLVVGYKKKAFDIYYGVSVSLTHAEKQIFAPEDDLPLKASAFAAPFGGRIGPSLDSDFDRLIEAGRNHYPNYKRYPDDTLGLVDRRAHGMQGVGGSYLNKGSPADDSGWPYFNVTYYLNGLGNVNGVASPLVYTAPNSRDPPDPFHPMRLMEIMAVSPNLYDIQNYTILNNYKDAYFPKICRLIADSSNCASASPPVKSALVQNAGTAVTSPGLLQGVVRGDFGHPYLGEEYYEGRNLNRIGVSSFVPFFFAPPGGVGVRYQETSSPGFEGAFGSGVVPPYLVKDPAHFLTGFGLPNYPSRYTNPIDSGQIQNMFMKCYKKTKNSRNPDFKHTPYGCAVGGRAGYSVRMLSCDEVRGFENDQQPQPSLVPYCG